uniref:Variant surface glycoprotein 1125.1229 n=1 Tax=Trypanosoma brucei TaxID=5691 RepID=A0A1J0R6T3_9TRYP|nr:variant surface glycoprotein 1125.1229 [Trypanosoma brucei]
MMERVRVEQPDVRQPTRCTAVFLFLLASFTGSNASPIETNDELADAVKSVCHEQLYLEELVKLLKQGNEQRTTNIEQISSDAQQYKIAAGIADTMDKRCLYMALHHKFRRLHQDQTARVKQSNADVDAALLAISEHIGVLKATPALAKTTLKLDATSVHGNGNANNNIRIQVNPTTGNQELCTAVSKLTEISAGHANIKLMQLKNIKLSDRKALVKNLFDQHVTLTGLSSCNASPGHTSPFATAIASCQGAGGTTLTAAQATTKPQYTGTSTALFQQGDPDKDCQQLALTQGTGLEDTKNLQHHLCKALKEHSVTVNTPTGLSGEELKDDEKLRVDVQNCVPELQGVKETSNAEHNKAVVEFIKSCYGTHTNKFETNIQAPLSTMKVSVRTASQTEKKEINKIATEEEATAALSDAEGIRNTKELETQKKSEPTVTADQKNRRKMQGETAG